MKKRIISIISVVLVMFVLCTTFSLSVSATTSSNINNQSSVISNIDFGCDVKTTSDTCLLVNLDTGVTVYSKNADVKRYPASLTKIMTYIVVAENVGDLTEKVKIKKSVLKPLDGTGSSISAVSDNIGKEFTVELLLKCLMISSGNDASLVLADYVGGEGGVDHFVEMMNEKAKELNCKNTNFVNPHGLHDKNHYTTAEDMYKISSYALMMPEFSEITNDITYKVGDITYLSTNYLIDSTTKYYYQYAKGIKTGTTEEAGRCIVTQAVADGYSYLAVIMHAPFDEAKIATEKCYNMIDAAELFRWAFKNIELKEIVARETPVCEEKVDLSWDKKSIQLSAENDYNILLPNNVSDKDISIKTDIPESIDAPINEGDYVGTASVYYKNEKISTFNLVADETVERSTLLYIIDILKNVFTSLYFIIAATIVVILFAVYLFVVVKHNKEKVKKKRRVKHYRDM